MPAAEAEVLESEPEEELAARRTAVAEPAAVLAATAGTEAPAVAAHSAGGYGCTRS